MVDDTSFGPASESLDELPALLHDLCSAIAAEIEVVRWSEPDDLSNPEDG